MPSISPLVPAMQRVDRLVRGMEDHPMNEVTPWLLMSRLAPGVGDTMWLSWLERLHHVRESMVCVAILREIQHWGDVFQPHHQADQIRRHASAVRMGQLLTLMSLGDMVAPAGADGWADMSSLVGALSAFLDQLEARWLDHRDWLERSLPFSKQWYLKCRRSSMNTL